MRFDLDKVFGVNQQALLVHARRAEVLAGNLANSDTPGYQARDIDFKEALQRAVGDQSSGAVLKTTHAAHLNSAGAAAGGIDDVLGEMKYRTPGQASVDGNTVDPLMEKSAFMENALLYQTNLQFLSGKIKNIKEALKVG
jgi:flagellar basal-body rod protein FlgB